MLFDPETGIRREACEYRDDVPHGRCTIYDADGDRSQRGYFENGKHAREWWFWSFGSSPGDGKPPLTSLAKSADERKNAARREALVLILGKLGAPDEDAAALAQAVLEYVDNPAAERRVICGSTLCVGPGRIPNQPLYVRFGPASADASFAALAERARLAQEADATVLAAARKQAEQEHKRLQTKYEADLSKYEKLSRRWDRTPLRCNDGGRSPTCVCGGSWQGCCSWHGGVTGCPDPPEAPTPPPPLEAYAFVRATARDPSRAAFPAVYRGRKAV